MKHKYSFKIENGRVKIYIDGLPFLSFNQRNFNGYYAFKDDAALFGIDFYLIDEVSGGKHTIETTYKTKEVWMNILKLLDKEL